MRLREFAADRPAADHDQVAWRLAEFEDRLVGEVRRRREAGDRRHEGARAGCDDEAPRAHDRAAGLDAAGVAKPRLRAQHSDAEPLEARLAVVGLDRGDHAADMRAHRDGVDARLLAMHAEARGLAHAMRGLAGGDQRLRRHAAEVEAVAAHMRALDQHDTLAQLGRARGDRQAARAGADDADIDVECTAHAFRFMRL